MKSVRNPAVLVAVSGLLVLGCQRERDALGPHFDLTPAQATEVEPNNTCPNAQDFGTVTLPFTVDGSLDPIPPASGDVDFFRFAGTPNSVVRVDLEGQSTGRGTLGDPFLGAFDSGCNPIAITDSGGIGLNAGFVITLPPDGVLTLAVTACCDFGFTEGGIGSYQLTIQEFVPPANDAFASATVIGALPFSNAVDITTASIEPGEPTPSCSFGFSSHRTVWYTFTPAATGVLSASVNAQFSTMVAVYSGGSLGALTEVNCSSPFVGTSTFLAQAGTPYHFLVDGFFGQSGLLEFRLEAIPPPPNDLFVNATAIAVLPFTDAVDLTGATVDVGEPTPSCAIFFGPVSRTAWYTFTPVQTGSISASIITAGFPNVVAAYTGNALTTLSEVGCGLSGGGKATFRAEANRTYYFLVGGLSGSGGPLEFRLEVTPPPVANFGFFPFDPSVFEVVQFFDQSFDPGGVGFASLEWTFGDGTSGTGSFATHQYAADGDYTVQHTVTTFDGRTASTSQTVHVRTHDVAITRFAVPVAASAGQTRHIVVGVSSNRYPETVAVQLFKSVPGGFQLVGTLTQSVLVRPSKRTTDFDFSYTFTDDDARIGKVTFKAVASIVGARDALSADNEAIAAPTKVVR